jgi:hypothetical protein
MHGRHVDKIVVSKPRNKTTWGIWHKYENIKIDVKQSQGVEWVDSYRLE